MGHKKGRRKRERALLEKECVERALNVPNVKTDLAFDDEDFPFDELGVAVSSGKCPFCGSKLESSDDGLRCPNGDWGAWFF